MFEKKSFRRDTFQSGGTVVSVETGSPIRECSQSFNLAKRLFDIVGSFLLLPLFAVTAIGLLILNPFFNKGPLIYTQERMGFGCKRFRVAKFRTMRPADRVTRGPQDPLEQDRITPLGSMLRASRLDELPQILNVLAGQMSLVGPRPDFIDHAEAYLEALHRYKDRHTVRPGITGLAQVEVGYVEDASALRRKVSADLYYIRNCDWALEAWIVWRTVLVVLGRTGS